MQAKVPSATPKVGGVNASEANLIGEGNIEKMLKEMSTSASQAGISKQGQHDLRTLGDIGGGIQG